MRGQRHAAGGAELPHACGLEAQLDQTRVELGRLLRGVVIGRQVVGQATDEQPIVAVGVVEHLVGGAVEVHAIDVVVADPAPVGRQGVRTRRWRCFAREPDTTGEVQRLLLALPGELAPADK